MSVFVAACGGPARDEAVASVTSAETVATVGDSVNSGCSTTAVWGLATQLVAELECMQPGLFGRIDGDDKIVLRSAAFPFMQRKAADALHKVAASRSSKLTVNSGLRTLPQQFLLHEWYKAGKCGISLAAAPGASNHQDGLAVDIDDQARWRTSFEAQGYQWLGASDAVHFDFTGESVDIGGASTKAFQRLWNRNNASDKIAEDGAYGKETAARLLKAPAAGFKLGASCKTEVLRTPIIIGADLDPSRAPEAGDGPELASTTDSLDADEKGGCSIGARRPSAARWGALAVLAMLIVRRRR